MKFQRTPLDDLYLIGIEKREDERGFFARTWDEQEFKKNGLVTKFVQASISYSKERGTLRGLHYQVAPYQETKLIQCLVGSIYDVVIDLREQSPTFKQHVAFTLEPAKGQLLYVPKGFAHGFLTLTPDSLVSYHMDEFFVADAARGVRFNDPAFGIQWPGKVAVISPRDNTYPNFSL